MSRTTLALILEEREEWKLGGVNFALGPSLLSWTWNLLGNQLGRGWGTWECNARRLGISWDLHLGLKGGGGVNDATIFPQIVKPCVQSWQISAFIMSCLDNLYSAAAAKTRIL